MIIRPNQLDSRRILKPFTKLFLILNYIIFFEWYWSDKQRYRIMVEHLSCQHLFEFWNHFYLYAIIVVIASLEGDFVVVCLNAIQELSCDHPFDAFWYSSRLLRFFVCVYMMKKFYFGISGIGKQLAAKVPGDLLVQGALLFRIENVGRLNKG